MTRLYIHLDKQVPLHYSVAVPVFYILPIIHMKVLDLKIQNVKNVPYAFIEFNDKVTYITGNNGAGKTTIIESIFQAISLTKS